MDKKLKHIDVNKIITKPKTKLNTKPKTKYNYNGGMESININTVKESLKNYLTDESKYEEIFKNVVWNAQIVDGNKHETLFHYACKYVKNIKMLIYILDKITTIPNIWLTLDQENNTPFHLACEYNSSNRIIFKTMLSKGAKNTWDLINKWGSTPFHRLCVTSYLSQKVLLIAFSTGAARTLYKVDYEGNTPLHIACKYLKTLELFQVFLQKLNRNKKTKLMLIINKQKQTPFHIICSNILLYDSYKKIKNILQLFLNNGAKETLLITDNNGKIPFHYISKYEFDDFNEAFELYKLMLEGSKTQWKIQDNTGKTPFHYICYHYDNLNKIKELINTYDANITLLIKDNNNSIPSDYSSDDIKKYLISITPIILNPRSPVSDGSIKVNEHINQSCEAIFDYIIIPHIDKDNKEKEIEKYIDDINKYIKPFFNKLKRLCTKLKEQKSCNIENTNTPQKNITTELYEYLYTSKRESKMSLYVNDKYPLKSLYLAYMNDNEIFKFDIQSSRIYQPGMEAIDIGGPIKQLVQNAIDEIYPSESDTYENNIKKLLVETEDESNICNLNWNFDIDFFKGNIEIQYEVEQKYEETYEDFIKRKLNAPLEKFTIYNRFITNDDETNRKNVFKFLGTFLIWATANNFKLPCHLNKAIFGKLIYGDKLTNDDYALYYIMNYPTIGNGLVNLLKNPTAESFKNSYLEFNNDDYILRKNNNNSRSISKSKSNGGKIIKKSKRSIGGNSEDDILSNDVNIKNYREYLGLRSKYFLMDKDKHAYKSFIKGFGPALKFLSQQSFIDLDILFTHKPITIEEIHNLYKSMIIYYSPIENQVKSRQDTLLWFNEILTSDDSLMVYLKNNWSTLSKTYLKNGKKNKSPPPPKKFIKFLKFKCFGVCKTASPSLSPINPTKQEELNKELNVLPNTMQQFLSGLLEWFTSNKNYNSMYTYTIQFSMNLDKNQLPKANTCFYKIVMPEDIRSRDDLLFRLILSILGSKKGFQFS